LSDRGTAVGTVSVWHDEDGWCVIEAEATPGGCWLHVSSVLVSGPARVALGDVLRFTFERGEQDGYAFRAVEAWPADREPDRTAHHEAGGMESTLTITSDDDPAGGGD